MTIKSNSFINFDAKRVPSPCFVVDEVAIENNVKILHDIEKRSGAKVLLALKAFSMFALAPLITRYLSGCCASGIHEALLAYEKFNGDQQGALKREVHTYSPAYTAEDIYRLCEISDHLVFNSFSQWKQYRPHVNQVQKKRPSLHCGLRINPMISTGKTAIYDPCAAGSRLGISATTLKQQFPDPSMLAQQGISGLHFHTLCENGFDELAQTLEQIERDFSEYLPHIDWLNCGGGHHITHPDYDREALIKKVIELKNTYQLQVYLEPGEAIAIHSGVLVSEVLDLTENEMNLAIIDSSATCHMPDTMEMPYRAHIFLGADSELASANIESGELNEKPYRYRIGGQTCLAGDVMGDYTFTQPLAIGQRILFDDMAHYTMVKTTTFNGIGLPSLAIWNSTTDRLDIVKEFGYNDFLQRLS